MSCLYSEGVVSHSPGLPAHAGYPGKKKTEAEHSEPYMAHVAPGKTETIAWQFTKAGNFNFGCLLPGHFEAGMVGNVAVK